MYKPHQWRGGKWTYIAKQILENWGLKIKKRIQAKKENKNNKIKLACCCLLLYNVQSRQKIP